ncbi:hypothetical protein Tco_0708660 [Tanacetum coccineum]
MVWLKAGDLKGGSVGAERPKGRFEFDLIAAARDLDEIKKVNANCILMANLYQASTSGTQNDKALVYDSDGSAEPDSFYHTEQKTALGYQNPFYLKQAQQKQQSVYNGKVLLEKHDPLDVYDSEETLQLAQETKFVRDFKSLAKESDESIAKHKALEFEIERLLRAVVSQDIMSSMQSNSVVEIKRLQTKLDCMKEKLETCIIKKEKEYVVLWNNWYERCKECKYDKISYDKAYNDMQNQIKRLQAQLGDLKGKSMDTQCASNTLDPLSHKLDDENVFLEYQLDTKFSEHHNDVNGTSVNTKFAKPSILGKPPSSSGVKIYSVTPILKTFSKPVTSHSIPKTQVSKVVKNTNVIAPGMFRTNPIKNSRVDNFEPNKHEKASVRTKLITVSQPRVITKKEVNSNTNGLPSTGVESNAKTRRPQPRRNAKNDRIPSASKSSCLSNNLEKVEEHHRNLQFFKTLNHRSSEGNNIKLAIRNEKSEVVYATCASNPQEPTSKGFPNSTSCLGRFTRLRRQNTYLYPMAVL